MRVSAELHVAAALYTGKNPVTYRVRGWVGSVAGLDILEKRKVSVLIGISTLDHPVHILATVLTMLPRPCVS